MFFGDVVLLLVAVVEASVLVALYLGATPKEERPSWDTCLSALPLVAGFSYMVISAEQMSWQSFLDATVWLGWFCLPVGIWLVFRRILGVRYNVPVS